MSKLESALHWFRQTDQHVTNAALELARIIDASAGAPTLVPILERPPVADRLSIYRNALGERGAALESLTQAYGHDAVLAREARIAESEAALNARLGHVFDEADENIARAQRDEEARA